MKTTKPAKTTARRATSNRNSKYKRLLKRLAHVRSGSRFTRDELNER